MNRFGRSFEPLLLHIINGKKKAGHRSLALFIDFKVKFQSFIHENKKKENEIPLIRSPFSVQN